MTDSKKSAPSASNPSVKRSEAKKRYNPPNSVPNPKHARSQRYLYGGMLFPSHVVAREETQSLEREVK